MDDAEIADAAVEAAESVIFSRFDRSDIEDVDVTVSFEDGQLDVDIYLNVPDEEGAQQAADDAALAARNAVDDVLE